MQEEFNLKKIKFKNKTLDEIDQKIETYQLSMDTSNFLDKVDHTKQIEFLKIKCLEILNDFEENKIDDKDFIPNKKIKIDYNDILND